MDNVDGPCPCRLLHSIARRSWWWVFGLFIALPAGALALLGLSAIGADEIERQQRIRDQQAHIIRLADVCSQMLSSGKQLTRGPKCARRRPRTRRKLARCSSISIAGMPYRFQPTGYS